MNRLTLLRRLGLAATKLTTDELEVLTLVATRAVKGRKRYGRLQVNHDGRDFAHEALEELVDGIFYMGAETLRAKRGDNGTGTT